MIETETLELKKSLAELKEGLISMSAILNKHGAGELWFGVAPNGQAVGLQATDKTLRDLSQAVGAHIEPKLYRHIGLQKLQGRDCIRVQFEGQDVPYFAYGRAYMRVADEDRQLSAAEIRKLIIDQSQQALRWDKQVLNQPLKAINTQKLRDFAKRAGLVWSRLGTQEPQRVEQALSKLEVLQDQQLLNAAQLFFTTAPVHMRCAVFMGTTSATNRFFWQGVRANEDELIHAMDVAGDHLVPEYGSRKAMQRSTEELAWIKSLEESSAEPLDKCRALWALITTGQEAELMKVLNEAQTHNLNPAGSPT